MILSSQGNNGSLTPLGVDSGSLLVLNLGGLDFKALSKDGLVERQSLDDCCDMAAYV